MRLILLDVHWLFFFVVVPFSLPVCVCVCFVDSNCIRLSRYLGRSVDPNNNFSRYGPTNVINPSGVLFTFVLFFQLDLRNVFMQTFKQQYERKCAKVTRIGQLELKCILGCLQGLLSKTTLYRPTDLPLSLAFIRLR